MLLLLLLLMLMLLLRLCCRLFLRYNAKVVQKFVAYVLHRASESHPPTRVSRTPNGNGQLNGA